MGGQNETYVEKCKQDCDELMQISGENPDVETLDLLGRLNFELSKFEVALGH